MAEQCRRNIVGISVLLTVTGIFFEHFAIFERWFSFIRFLTIFAGHLVNASRGELITIYLAFLNLSILARLTY